MLDIKFVRENPDIVKQNIKNKFQDKKLPLVDEVIELDDQNRKIKKEVESLRAEKNSLSKKIGGLMKEGKKEEAEEIKAKVAAGNDKIDELTAEERAAYFEDVARVARAIMAAFHPDKVNYGAYGDTGHHLHFHLCPKYKDEFEWGGVFLMNPDKKYLTDAEYAEMIEKIKANM